MKYFLSTIDKISEWSGKSVGYLVVVVTLLVTLEVVLRYVFNAPTTWSSELVTYLCGALYLMGGAYVHKLKSHVNVDILYSRLTPRMRAIIDLVTFPLFLLFFGGILWAGAQWAGHALIVGQTSGTTWAPPIGPIRLVIPLAAFLMLLQGVARFIRDFTIATKCKDIA